MFTVNSREELFDIADLGTKGYNYNKEDLHEAFDSLWELTYLVKECLSVGNTEKQVMNEGICIYYEVSSFSGEVNAEYLVPKLGINSISLYIVSESREYDEDENLEDANVLNRDEDLVATIYKDRIVFYTDLKDSTEGTDFSTFAFILHKIWEYGDELRQGDGDFSDMYSAISNAYRELNKKNEGKGISRATVLNSRFTCLYKNTNTTLGDVVKALKTEGFKDSEIYKSIVSVLRDATWDE